MKPRDSRAQAGFIDEDESRGIEIELVVEQVLATLQEVWALLLQCMCPSSECSAAPTQPDIERAVASGNGSLSHAIAGPSR